MPLTVPQLDDRSFLDFLGEAQARIPIHNPEWTNFNDSDPGITVLQLFAFMAESLLYRSNRYPDLNRLKFLQLLGVGLRPATAGHGVITIVNERGPMATATLASNLGAFAGKVGFVTQNGLDVIPVEMRIYTRAALTNDELAAATATYTQLFQSQVPDPSQLQFYKTVLFDPTTNKTVNLSDGSTIDGSLWILLLTRPGEDTQAQTVLQNIAGKTITLGMMPVLDATSSVLSPGGVTADQAPVAFQYQISTGNLTSDAIPLPIYQTLTAIPDANPLKDLTLVQITLPSPGGNIGTWESLQPLQDGTGDFPPALDDADALKRALCWIRVGLPSLPDGSSAPLNVEFGWLGINAARVLQRILVPVESLGSGTGEPDQTVSLANTPVLPDSLTVTVNGNAWNLIDDLYSASPEVPVRPLSASPTAPMPPADPAKAQVFALDPEAGVVTFGDGLHGARPAAGAQIFASYAYGGGNSGNVGVGAIKNCPQLPAGFKVSNPIPTWGGDDGESIDAGEKQIPNYLRHRDRAVSAEDFKDIVQETPGIDLGRVEAIPLFAPGQAMNVPGAVTVMVIPNDPRNPQGPMPNSFFLDSVCKYLDPRRLLTTEVYVQGPDYVPVWVSVGINIVAGFDVATVREAVTAALKNFLSPLDGGPEQTGWPLQKTVEQPELLAQAVRVAGVSSVNNLYLFDSSGTSQNNISMSGLNLPRLDLIRVAQGDAEQQLSTTVVASTPQKRFPVPVLPVEC